MFKSHKWHVSIFVLFPVFSLTEQLAQIHLKELVTLIKVPAVASLIILKIFPYVFTPVTLARKRHARYAYFLVTLYLYHYFVLLLDMYTFYAF